MEQEVEREQEAWKMHFPSLVDLGKFALFAVITVVAAWIAETGRVMYDLIMLIVAGALVYAVLDLVDYELVKRKRERQV
jgi:heme/copper-type cytochrome/quinol oxidase subunit 4